MNGRASTGCSIAAWFATVSAAWAQPPITALAMVPNTDLVVVGSQVGVEVRALPSLEMARTLDTELAAVHAIVFSPDGSQLILAGGSPGEAGGFELRAWPSGKLVLAHHDFDDAALSVDWSTEDGRIAVAGENDVLVYAGSSYAKRLVLGGHSARVRAVRFLADGLVVSAGVDQSLRLFDGTEGRSLRVLQNHTAEVTDLAVRPGDWPLPTIASCGADRTVRFWQPTIGRLVRFARLDEAEPLALAWTGDGKTLLAACTDGQVRVIDPETATVRAALPAIDGWAYEIAVWNDELAICGGERNQLQTVRIDRR